MRGQSRSIVELLKVECQIINLSGSASRNYDIKLNLMIALIEIVGSM